MPSCDAANGRPTGELSSLVVPSEPLVPTFRRWAETGLRALPFVAVALFIFQYAYATTFLEQFGVSPDQVGVDQVHLATRAALFSVVILAVYGLAVAVVALVVTAVMERPSAAAGARADRRRKHLQVTFVVVSASCAALAAALLNPSTWFLVGFIVVFTAALIYWILTDSWRQRAGMLVWAFLLLSIVSVASYFGGVSAGNNTAKTGHIPGLLGIFGVDVLQVRPTWIEPSAKPVGFRDDQDVLVLGTAMGSVFLYDCNINATRRVAASQVALDYSLQDATQAVARLKCRQ